MSRRYKHLSDEALTDRITKFTDALEELSLGGDVTKVQTDGRLMELTRANAKDGERILDLLIDEQDIRANGGVRPGRAIGMRFFRS